MTEKDDTPHEEVTTPAIIEAGYLRLPFDHEQFRDFIKGLLGKPQSITKSIVGSYEIEVSDIQSLHELLRQRIEQQNAGALASFTARIKYSDNSTVELNSLPEFLSYNEVRPIYSQALHLKWDYLVQFQDKRVPERQSVQVSFIASGEEGFVRFDVDDPVVFLAHHSALGRAGFIGFRIEHTARTWGADLEALLSNYFKSMLQTEHSVPRWIRKRNGPIGLTLGIAFFALIVSGLFVTTRRFAAAQMAIFTDRYDGSQIVTQDAIRVIGEYLASGAWSQYMFAAVGFLVISVFIAIWLGIWATAAADTVAPSFILLNRESHNHRTRVLKRLRRKWVSFAGSVLLSIIIGVVANWIFAFFFS